MRCAWIVTGWLMAGLVALPASVNGQGATQASITGIVRDASGAVLPGVTVEASSDALIEKVRAGVTDATGRYRIAGLPPGTYNITFTLTGFSTVRREGLALAGSFVATVDVSLQVGALAETITVTGEAPVVDVSSAQRQQVINSEVMASIPANRSYENLAALVPGIQLATTAQNVGGIQGPVPPYFTGHGGSNFEGRLRIDGMTTGGSTGGVSLMALDTGNAAEITVSTTGGLADAENGGAVFNIVPRSGGNIFAGNLFLMGAGGGMQSDNFTQALKDAGLRSPSKLDKIWDANFGMGGPIKRDQAVVLRDDPQHGELPVHLGHVLQQERGQSQPGLLVLRSGSEPAGDQRPEVAGRVAAADVAGDAAQQGDGLLERAAAESRRRQAAAARRSRPRRVKGPRSRRSGCIRRSGRRRCRTACCSRRRSRA